MIDDEKLVIKVRDGYSPKKLTIELPPDVDKDELVESFVTIMQWLTWTPSTIEQAFAEWLAEKGWEVSKE